MFGRRRKRAARCGTRRGDTLCKRPCTLAARVPSARGPVPDLHHPDTAVSAGTYAPASSGTVSICDVQFGQRTALNGIWVRQNSHFLWLGSSGFAAS